MVAAYYAGGGFFPDAFEKAAKQLDLHKRRPFIIQAQRSPPDILLLKNKITAFFSFKSLEPRQKRTHTMHPLLYEQTSECFTLQKPIL